MEFFFWNEQRINVVFVSKVQLFQNGRLKAMASFMGTGIRIAGSKTNDEMKHHRVPSTNCYFLSADGSALRLSYNQEVYLNKVLLQNKKSQLLENC